MFITVSVGGMIAVVATGAAAGAITSLYIRAKTIMVIDGLRDAVDNVKQSPFISRWRMGSTQGSEKSPTK